MRKIMCLLALVSLICPLTFTACSGERRETGYTIVAEYFPEESTLSAQMNFDFKNETDNALSELKFQLWANAYREDAKNAPVSDIFYPAAYYDGESYGEIQIESVTGGEYRVCGEDENILSVTLAEPLYPDESVSLGMNFRVSLAKINHRLGVGQHAVNLTNFYPVLCHLGENGFEEYVYSVSGDPFVSACANYDVTLTVPENYTAVCGGGGAENCVAQNGKRTYHVIAENVRDIAFVLGENFQSVSKTAGGVTVEYYYFDDPAPETALKAAADSLLYFSETFSPYERAYYRVVQTDFVYGGMENAALSMITNTAAEAEVVEVVAHETAHQWWYSQVGSNQFTESWQDEGLAEYSVALFFDAYPEYGRTYSESVQLSERAYRSYFSVYTQLGGADTVMSRALTKFAGEYEYRSVAYDKGVIMFDRVREAMGDRKFFSALSRYAKEYTGKIATRGDLIACFERSGSKVEGLFASFLDGRCVI